MSRKKKRGAFIGWWLIAFIACCVQLLQSPESDVFLLEPATKYADPSITDDVWNIPLVSQSFLEEGLAVSEWLAAALAALLITSMVNRHGQAPFISKITLVVLLATVWSPDNLLTWFWLLLTSRILHQQPRVPWNWKTTLLQAASVAGAILTTLDFAIVVVLTLTLAVDSLVEQRKVATSTSSVTSSFKHQLACLCVIGAVCVILSSNCNGFGQVLLRPLSAASMIFTQTPYSSLQPVTHSLLDSLVVAVTTLVMLSRVQNRDADNPTSLITITVFLAVGLLCREYLAAVVLVLLNLAAVKKTEAKRSKFVSVGSFVNSLTVVGMVAITALQFFQLQPLLSSDPLRQRLVDLSSLTSKTTVLLLNPQATPRWKSSTSPPNVQFLVDDRWERFTAGQAQNTQQTFVDLLRGRRENYLLATTEAGGTRKWMGELNPDLLVVDSDQWTAIRQLSLDPNWNVIAIDGHQVVLAAAASAEMNTRAQEASRLWFFLEWPNPGSRVSVEGILEPGLEHDAIQVAGVLNAMRLPYAALRVLPSIDSVECDLQRAWSYTELAIRCARQNGQTSLLDVIRAKRLLDRLGQQNLVTPSQKKHVLRLQEALAEALTWTLELKPNDQQSSALLQFLAGSQIEKALTTATADPANCREQMTALIISGIESGDSEWTRSAQILAASPECPNRLRSELLFYLGCLAMEERRIDEAIQHFRQALQHVASTQENTAVSLTLCRLYLVQLTQ